MRYVIEFGVRGGAHKEALHLPSAKLAQDLAASLVAVFNDDTSSPSATPSAWRMTANCPRLSWTSSTHFISVSKLDGVARGPASAQLWRKG